MKTMLKIQHKDSTKQSVVPSVSDLSACLLESIKGTIILTNSTANSAMAQNLSYDQIKNVPSIPHLYQESTTLEKDLQPIIATDNPDWLIKSTKAKKQVEQKAWES